MKKSVKVLIVATAAGLALVSVGCGQAPQATLPAPGILPGPGTVSNTGVGQCFAGQFNLGGACVYGTDFASACQDAYGQLVSFNGAQVCKFNLYYAPLSGLAAPYSFAPAYIDLEFGGTSSYWSTFPVITPSTPSSQYGFPTGLMVQAGDTLTVTASGGWGGTSGNSYLGGRIIFYSTNCSQVDVNGYNGNSLETNGGLPAGLVGSDGTSVFMVGSHSVTTIQHTGMLGLGFNVPVAPGECAQANVTQLKITRCVDAAGATHPASQCF